METDRGGHHGSKAQQIVLLAALCLAALGACPATSVAAGNWNQAVAITLPANASPSYPFPFLSSVACPEAGACVAVGSYRDDANRVQGMIVVQSGGSWGSASEFAALPPNASTSAPSSGLNGIACPAAGTCVATGWYVDNGGRQQAMVANESAGVWEQATEILPPANVFAGVPGREIGLGSVACRATGECVAFGGYADQSLHWQGMVTTETGGVWGATSEITLPANAVPSDEVGPAISVACAPGGSCTAVGEYPAKGDTYPMTLSESAGVWQPATELAAPANLTEDTNGQIFAGLHDLACPVSESCVAIGNYGASAGDGAMVATDSNGVWSQASEVAMLPVGVDSESVADPVSIACTTAESCVAAGWREGTTTGQPLIATETTGTWAGASPTLPSGATGAILETVACPPSGFCVAAGVADLGMADQQAIILSEGSGASNEGDTTGGNPSSNGGLTTSSPTPIPPSQPASKPASPNAVTLVGSSLAVTRSGSGTIKLYCIGTTTCHGRLLVSVKSASKAHVAKLMTLTIARASFSIPAGKTALVRFKLNANGRRLLKAAGRLMATLMILGVPPTPATLTSAVRLGWQKH